MEAQKNVKEKPAPVKRKASTDEPETEAKKKDVVSSLMVSPAYLNSILLERRCLLKLAVLHKRFISQDS